MKKVFYLLGIMLLMAGVAKAQDSTKNGPEISFEKIEHNFGDVALNDPAVYEFSFTNTGNEPLLLQKPKSSCTCTVSDYPREPILPGESKAIKVSYKTNHASQINKFVTVYSNAVNLPEVKLSIKGRVLDKPAEPNEALPKNNGLGTGSPLNNN